MVALDQINKQLAELSAAITEAGNAVEAASLAGDHTALSQAIRDLRDLQTKQHGLWAQTDDLLRHPQQEAPVIDPHTLPRDETGHPDWWTTVDMALLVERYQAAQNQLLHDPDNALAGRELEAEAMRRAVDGRYLPSVPASRAQRAQQDLDNRLGRS
jgi:hypothetical protein